MKLRRNIFSFRNRVVVIIVGVSLGALSILYTNKMAQRLKEKEQHDEAPCGTGFVEIDRGESGEYHQHDQNDGEYAHRHEILE